jgi:hypothetical protein
MAMAPSDVRTGTSRGRCSSWWETVSPVSSLDDRVRRQESEEDAGEHQGRPEQRRDRVVAGQVDVPRREQATGPVEEEDVPVGLRSRRHLCRVVGAPEPDGVDLHQPAQRGDRPEDHEEQADRLGRERREQANADHVVLGPPGTRELGVLQLDQHQQVQRDQRQEKCREQEDVDDVEAADDLLADEVAVEHRPVRPRADHGNGQHDRRGDAQTRPREQVIRQRVAGETLEEGQHEQADADEPVRFARTTECAGEEDAQQVHDDGRDEQQRRPVVDLADEQTAPHVEGQVHRRVVRGGHLHAPQRRVRALVDDLTHGRVEEEGQKGAESSNTTNE